MIVVDTNIIIDLLGSANMWKPWSRRAFREAALVDEIAINHIILAEFHAGSIPVASFEHLRESMPIRLAPFSEDAARRAGLAHGKYRRRGGTRTSILADFLIGAHCVALGAALITRDGARFGGYFPELTLITPETAP